jgi:hypothetical protein
MRITFRGAAGMVTGSPFVVELGWDPMVAEHGQSVHLARLPAGVGSGS